MGVHVGEIQTVAGTIVGMAVHEAARIGAAAHGGQVLVSATAADLAGTPPDAGALLDLGPHRLKDIGEPINLFQLTHDDLRTDFPPPRSQGASRNNLPAQVTAFIGRDREVGEIATLLEESRLVTVTGAGGAGKSRTALRVAAEQGGRFGDGVWFVDLATVSDRDRSRSTDLGGDRPLGPRGRRSRRGHRATKRSAPRRQLRAPDLYRCRSRQRSAPPLPWPVRARHEPRAAECARRGGMAPPVTRRG